MGTPKEHFETLHVNLLFKGPFPSPKALGPEKGLQETVLAAILGVLEGGCKSCGKRVCFSLAPASSKQPAVFLWLPSSAAKSRGDALKEDTPNKA